jgi:hypothetical protein
VSDTHIFQSQAQAQDGTADISSTPSTPFGERTDGIESAANMVEEVVHGVKAAVDGAIAWAEKKVDALGSEQNSTGPYSSPATCMPSDLDVIASGVLPGMPTVRQYDGTAEGEEKAQDKQTEKECEKEDKKQGCNEKKGGAHEARL